MRKTIAVSAAVAALLLAGCTGESEETAATSTPLAPLEEVAAEPTPEPTTPEPPPAPEVGSRDNPGNPDTDVATFAEAWEVEIGRFDADARPEIQAENQFNDPPAEGNTFIMLPVKATYIGPDSGTAWLDLDFAFVTADGRSFDQHFAVIPNDLSDVAELYNGGVGEGNVVFEVPADALEGATFAVSYGWGEPLFFAAVPQA